ncbi:alpha/beta-hydrolase [Gymnopus androsaceus JB14]|uniref:Carboxylic ester hydrolase n=1 Tax=Gymnopus androsaceus JB14 TaxID=1447944 RepID=A0A6A4HYK8_9AGAR|nr:alpha/beta-hydrolase [Gymnopus androsaceus JB14]
MWACISTSLPKLASPLPLIVAIHFCTGTAQAYFQSTQYANLADQYGFLVIYPNAPRSGGCFDVNTPQTLTHNGGGDSQGIASMVSYAISTYGVDPTKVFVTGTSSGAMMTNVMAGSYPNLFAAASAYSGVPSWSTQCADGDLIQTAAQWGNEVRAAYPGYTGSRPKMMLWHGTADTTLYYPNFGEEIKEWTNVFGLSQTATTTTQNDPQSGYTMTTYGSQVVGYSAAGVGHTVPVHETIDLAWFGIPLVPFLYTSPDFDSAEQHYCVTTTTTTTSATSTGTGTGGTAEWGQCGGIWWSGNTNCVAGTTCIVINPYYSQCMPPT